MRLPVQLWHYIFEFCDSESMVNVARSVDGETHKTLCRKYAPVMTLTETCDVRSEVIDLNIRFHEHLYEFKNARRLNILVTEATIKTLKLTAFPNLNELKINFMKPCQDVKLPELPRKLKKLTISSYGMQNLTIPECSLTHFQYYYYIISGNVRVLFTGQVPTMETIDIYRVDIARTCDAQFPNLQNLKMRLSTISADFPINHIETGWFDIIPKYSLVIHGSYGVYIEYEKIKHLRHLCIINPLNVPRNTDLSFISKLPNLLTLTINWHVEYDDIIQHIPESLYSVTVRLYDSEKINHRNFKTTVYRTITEF